MRRKFCLLLILLLVIPNLAVATPPTEKVKVAFVRNHFLWIKKNDKEEKITATPANYTISPQWSHDGKWLAYGVEPKEKISPNLETQTEIWVYNLETKKHKRITYDGSNLKWSPVVNILSFKSGGVLNVSNLDQFYNVALGVGDYNWFPDGKAFIASSSASLHPDGWTNPILYKIGLERDFTKITSLTKNVEKFYTIPNELKKGKVSILAIDATDFQFSPNGKWISFMVSPTASWSMDSNMMCVISADGQTFYVLDELIWEVDSPKWAFHQNRLGYIAGGRRIVLGFKNKKMQVTDFPTFHSLTLTPPHFAELGFTWRDDHSLIVSRVKEREWSNNPTNRPDPSLFLIKMGEQKQVQLTHPPRGFGDYHPIYLPSAGKLTWVRKKDIAETQKDLWIAEPNGKDARVWIKNVEDYDFYQGK